MQSLKFRLILLPSETNIFSLPTKNSGLVTTFATRFLYDLHCVVPENIQTPTTEGIGNSRGVGGSEAQEIPEGRGVGP